MRHKTKFLTPSPNPSLLPRLKYIPRFLCLLPNSGTGRWGLRVASHIITVTSSSTDSCPAPMWSTSHRRQSFLNFILGPSKRLQFFVNCSPVCPFHLSSPQGVVLQEWTSPVWITQGVTSPDGKTAPGWAHHVITASFKGIHLLWHGVHHGLQMDVCSIMDLHGSRTTCHIIIFTTGCRGLSALAPRAHSFPPSSLTLVSVQLLHIFSLISSSCCYAEFSPFLNMLLEKLPL